MADSLEELEAQLGPRKESGKCVSEWMYQAESKFLFELAKRLRPGQRVVEIGIFGGADLALFALEACDGVEIVGIDDWSNETRGSEYTRRKNPTGEWVESVDLRSYCLWNLESCGVREKVDLVERSSHIVGKTWNLPIDVLIIDGDHSVKGAKSDLEDFSPWVRRGGVLVMDDVGSNGDVRQGFYEWANGENPQSWKEIKRWEMPEGKAVVLEKA